MTSRWWRQIEPGHWGFAANRSTYARELQSAVLAALLIASTRTPMATIAELRPLLVDVGYHDPIELAELRDTLDDLVHLRLVAPFKDYTAPVGGYGAALRRQEAWALTKEGRVVVAAVRTAISQIDRSLQLPPKLLDDIEATIRTLITHLDTDPSLLPMDADRIRLHTNQLHSASGDFYEAVAALVSLDITDDQVFTGSRERILQVLRQFANQTQRSLARVQSALSELRDRGYGHVAERALPGAGVVGAGEEQAWVDDVRQQLEGLDAWFTPGGSIERLIDASIGAINTLLGAIERRFYAMSRGSDLGADFRQLARMLHAQTSERDAQQVFAAAFGLWPARHPRQPDTESISALMPTAEGSQSTLRATLRRTDTGAYSTGRPAKIPDVRAERESSEGEMIADLERMSRILADLATGRTVSLTHFAGLDAEHTEVLVSLLEEALDAFDPTVGFGTAERLECRMRLWPAQPGRVITVPVAGGELTAPDFQVEVTVDELDAEQREAI